MKTQSTFAKDRVRAITKTGRTVFLTLRSFDRLLHVNRIANVNGHWKEI